MYKACFEEKMIYLYIFGIHQYLLYKMQPIYCDNKDHKDNPLNLVCLEQRCIHKGLICSFCLLSEHQDHVKNVFPLKTIILSLNKANNPKN